MRLKSVKRQMVLSPDFQETTSLIVTFQEAGAEATISLPLPEQWDTLNRAEKLTWVKQAVITHLLGNTYGGDENEIFPDRLAQEAAADQFEQLPGWATWSAVEAEGWVEANVTNLATAKTALKAMAKAIVYLRDCVIER
ncbi:MAG: hypothetical protein BroJett011_04120 [Chloroflexota bacterium]|nr:MAG: hypothetical protein BroJett011_04120 [Chloroflexota bacterium]